MDHALSYRVQDAEERVFQWMHGYVNHTRESGSEALATFGFGWVIAWQNWWDDGSDE